MTLEQALELLDQVCASVQGTRQDHVTLQQAMQVVGAATIPVGEKDKDVKIDAKKKEPDGNK